MLSQMEIQTGWDFCCCFLQSSFTAGYLSASADENSFPSLKVRFHQPSLIKEMPPFDFIKQLVSRNLIFWLVEQMRVGNIGLSNEKSFLSRKYSPGLTTWQFKSNFVKLDPMMAAATQASVS